MRVVYQFENCNREPSQLRSLIDDLKRGLLVLEADIAAVVEFEQHANPTKSAHPPIAARTLTARRDNLVRTILMLEKRINAAGAETRSADPKHLTPSGTMLFNE
jgi:type II secretory pathway component PulJ